jgi:hypothetical protein
MMLILFCYQLSYRSWKFKLLVVKFDFIYLTSAKKTLKKAVKYKFNEENLLFRGINI